MQIKFNERKKNEATWWTYGLNSMTAVGLVRKSASLPNKAVKAPARSPLNAAE
jgi:hypothetical protein